MTVSNDTVDNAKATPELQQPWEELGLKQDEYDKIVSILGRRPTDAELTVYSVMWSEHCSYKSSKTHLRTSVKPPPRKWRRRFLPVLVRTPALWTSVTVTR